MATSSNVTLEDLEDLAVDSPMLEDHLSYPAPSVAALAPEPKTQSEKPRKLLSDRLYIGNLHPTADEYTVLRTFNKFGKVTKLDFLFHKSGPFKGKPRGFAFIEYSKPEEAKKAQAMAHDKLLRGRKIVVTFAQQAPLEQYGDSGSSSYKNRKGANEVGRPTAISILKTGMNSKHEPKTSTKIAMMEAKLRELEAEKAQALAPPKPSTLPYNPSLPLKPQTPFQKGNDDTPAPDGPQHRKSTRGSTAFNATGAKLPTLPIAQPSSSKTTLIASTAPKSTVPKVARETKNKLAGVVIKPKSRLKPAAAPNDPSG